MVQDRDVNIEVPLFIRDGIMEWDLDEDYVYSAPGGYEWCGGRDWDGVPDGGDVQWTPDWVWVFGA